MFALATKQTTDTLQKLKYQVFVLSSLFSQGMRVPSN